MRSPLILSALFLTIFGCATTVKKESAAPLVGGQGPWPEKIYYADLQILSETTKQALCVQDGVVQKTTTAVQVERIENDSGAAAQLVRGIHPQYYVINLKLQAIGFDQLDYQTTVKDGVILPPAPYQLKIRRRPGDFIEINYLSEVVKIKLNETPVYSFTVAEQRGRCEVTHNVNIFAEHVGYLPLIKP